MLRSKRRELLDRSSGKYELPRYWSSKDRAMVLKIEARRRMTRAERIEETKTKLLAAGIEVVGRLGYSESSIALITQHAEVAQGTFYNYFESRQDLLDQLLPHLGKKLLEFIRERLVDIQDDLERERVGFVAFFDFVAKYPSFFRIFHEAEIFAPAGYESHMANMAGGYMRALSRSLKRGTISGYTERELELITFILLAARDFVGKRYTQGAAGIAVPPTWVVNAYMKFLTSGLVRSPGGALGYNATDVPGPRSKAAELTFETTGPLTVVAHAVLSEADCSQLGASLAQIGERASSQALRNSKWPWGQLVSSSFSRVRKVEPRALSVEACASVGHGVRTTVSLTYMQSGLVVAYGTAAFEETRHQD
jgi:AcrR family transcriptional regulator